MELTRIDKLFKGGFSYTPPTAELVGRCIFLLFIQVKYFTERYGLELAWRRTLMLNNKLLLFYVANDLQTTIHDAGHAGIHSQFRSTGLAFMTIRQLRVLNR